ncbi:MAG TPA: glycosyltransferase [Flavobacterium sp.]|uniref:glycosyltransferase n=1 Tax=unclassified Flavobacterium TaxID=196869 RepID=UPI0025BEF88C|nr:MULTISPECIES: glycosyltransferase [unclassified Flavobacterium]HRE79341.1 glycosyltransferase [Flavobacterium sp.]
MIEVFIVFKNCLFNFNKALKLYRLNIVDGFSTKKAFRNVLINSHFLNYKLSWLHFGFGTMAVESENVAEAIGAKMAVSFRGFDFYVYPVKFPDCYHLLFTKKVKYHVLSNDMKDKLIEQGILPESIHKITPAIDVDFFDSAVNFNNNSKIQFLTISRLHWIKGLEYIIEAFSIFKSQNIPFHFTIIGDGAEKEKLMFVVNQLGLSECVNFKGNIPHNEVKNNLKKYDYYIQYSLQEGFCNAVLEAQAMGLLCIVSDADGLKENVLHNKTGWVVPKRNPLLLSEKIMEVINLTEDARLKIKQNAVERAKKEFNLAKQKESFKSFYLN